MNSLAGILALAECATTQNRQALKDNPPPAPISETRPIDEKKVWARKAELPPRWEWATEKDPFGLGYVTCGPPKEEEIREVDESKPLAFVGPTGTGKTSAACWKAYQLFKSRPKHVLIAPVCRIGQERRKVQLGKPLPEFLERCMTVPVLILDDLGQEDPITSQEIRSLAFHRHNCGLQTWVTTSLTPAQFIAKYRPDVFRRLFREGAKVFVLGN